MSERVMQQLARLLSHVFFRKLDVIGAENLPRDRPVILVANHVNGLVDALVMMTMLKRFPRFMGKATLFKILPLVPLLKLARVIPVHRAKDAEDGKAGDKNSSAFRTCRDILSHGGVVAVFPEGISHDEPSLQPLKTGAARIALEAAIEDGVADIAIVPVGLVYDDKARFRSRGLVRVGEPISVEQWARDAREHPVIAVRDLTDAIDVRLRAVGPDFPSWDEAKRWARVAGIVTRPTGDDAGELESQDDVARALANRAATAPDDPTLGELRDALDDYEQRLAVVGLSDAQLASGASASEARAMLGRSLAEAVVAAPAVAAGVVVHAIPYSVMKQLAKLPKNENVKATVKVLGCFGLFTIVYTGTGIYVGRRAGVVAGLFAFVAAPLSGWVTLRTAERLHAAGGVADAARALRHAGSLEGSVEDLLARRDRVIGLTDSVLAGATATSLPPARVAS